jgi:Leucine-rich repeat (LRR) protein
LTFVTEIRNFERASKHCYYAAQQPILDPTTHCDKTGLRHRKEHNPKNTGRRRGITYRIRQVAFPAGGVERLKNKTVGIGACEEIAKVRLYPEMLLQVVLVFVIVTAVPVNAQDACVSACQCSSNSATCNDLFSDVTNMTQYKFRSGLQSLIVTGRTYLEMDEDLFLRWNITSLRSLDLRGNKITKIWQQAFYSLADLGTLKLEDNSITTLDYRTFFNNTLLSTLSLSRNSIADLHRSIFEKNIRLSYLSLDENKITSLHQDLFKNNMELTYVHLEGNMIVDIHPSTFRNNGKIGDLRLSRNQITLIHPHTFIYSQKLVILKLQHNKIREIGNSSLPPLEQLSSLDLSNNNIEQLNPLVFSNLLNSTNRQEHRRGSWIFLNLARNKIRTFNLESYFPIIRNSDSSTPTFPLYSLNLNSNRLTTLDVASMKLLNRTLRCWHRVVFSQSSVFCDVAVVGSGCVTGILISDVYFCGHMCVKIEILKVPFSVRNVRSSGFQQPKPVNRNDTTTLL